MSKASLGVKTRDKVRCHTPLCLQCVNLVRGDYTGLVEMARGDLLKCSSLQILWQSKYTGHQGRNHAFWGRISFPLCSQCSLMGRAFQHAVKLSCSSVQEDAPLNFSPNSTPFTPPHGFGTHTVWVARSSVTPLTRRWVLSKVSSQAKLRINDTFNFLCMELI